MENKLQTIKRFKQWVKAFETAKELFPELDTKQWLTLADCLDEAINNRQNQENHNVT